MKESGLLLLPDVLDDLLVDVGLLSSELLPEVIINSVILSCGTKTERKIRYNPCYNPKTDK